MIITIGSMIPDDKGSEYNVIDNINSGGFGQVFLWERETGKKKFAVKIMLDVFPAAEEYKAFQDERMAAKETNVAHDVVYEFMYDGKIYEE